LTVKVTDYYFVGDGKSFDKHFYVIAVSAETFQYTVDRSYVDFVELDRILQKKFPESNIATLPLDDARNIKKVLASNSTAANEKKRISLGTASTSGSRNSLAYPRESLMGGGAAGDLAGTVFWVPDENREDIGGKYRQLDQYMQMLLQKHEIVGADELLLFLNEERRTITGAEEPDEPLSVHDLLLAAVPVNKCVVHRSEEYQYHVPRGHLVLWRFSTLHYDIGFSVEMNGAAKVPYTRCNSHRSPVCGILEVTEPSICLLKWDNSYAKCESACLYRFSGMIVMYFLCAAVQCTRSCCPGPCGWSPPSSSTRPRGRRWTTSGSGGASSSSASPCTAAPCAWPPPCRSRPAWCCWRARCCQTAPRRTGETLCIDMSGNICF
jgi:hypothetical protein